MLTQDVSQPLQMYANVVSAINQFNGVSKTIKINQITKFIFKKATCTPSHYDTYISELSLQDTANTAGRSWTWQTCSKKIFKFTFDIYS